MGKIFPIKTETSCQLKWTWNTLRLYNGISSACHRASMEPIDISTGFNFHNTPDKISARKTMLAGEWPSGGCEYCQKIEEQGGTSDRMFHLQIPDQSPLELEIDVTATSVTPRIVEVYLDNVCNMSCIYCWDGFSSKIQQENIKFGEFNNRGVVIKNNAVEHPDRETLKNKFWAWLDDNCHSLARLHILGGEPFYQQEFETILAFLEKDSYPNLEFNIVSNLNIAHDRFKKYINRIKQLDIKRFDLTASVDCFGPEQEYVRYGLDLDLWRKNFEFLVSESWITLNVNQTISGLTIKTMHELIQFINQHRQNREIGHYFGTTLMTHSFLHPEIFGKDFFKNDFDKLIVKENILNINWVCYE